VARTFLTPIALPGDPVSALQAATKQYVDSRAGSPFVSVTSYGATGNGTTDDTAAINAAIAAALAAGTGIVWFPAGTYATTSVIDIPENVTLEGVHGDSIAYTTSPPSPCVIKPLATHTGTAILRMRGKTETSRTYDHVGARIRNLTLDGVNTPAGTKGIQVAALVREARFEYVSVNNTKDTAFWFGAGAVATTTMPQSLRLIGCLANKSGNNGYTFTNVPDSTIVDCESLGATNSGFYFAGFMNGQVQNARSEWSGQQGILITSGYWGTGQGSGGANFLGCTTDRSGFNGLYIDTTTAGSAPLQFTNCTHRRDGRNGGTGGGGYAGIFIGSGNTMPIVIDNVQIYPGVDDDGTKTNSPQIGISATGANPVTLTSGYIHAATTPVSGGAGLIVGNGVGTATGTTGSPTRVAPIADVPATDSRLSDTRTPTDGTVTDAKVSGSAAIAESKLALASDAAAGTASRRTLGTGALQAAAGNDSRLSDTRTPTDGSVTDAKVAAGAAIAESKLSLASDAAAGTASRRTLGTGALQAAAGNHTHSGYALTTDLAGYVPVTQRGPIGGVVTLTYAASITPDASLGNHFRLVLTGGATILAPTNGTDGQRILFEVQASGAARLCTFSGYELGGVVTSGAQTVASGLWGYFGVIYRNGTWRLLAADDGA
jgi:hypothetical protein